MDRIKLLSLFISIALYILSYPPFNISFLIFFAIVPLFLLLPKLSPKEAFLYGFLYGFGFYGINFYWIPNLVAKFANLWVGILANLLLISYLSLYYGIFLWGVKKKEESIFFPAFFMALLQWIRSHGPLAFNWGSLGEPLVNIIPFLQWASVFGELGLSFFVVLVNRVFSKWRALNFHKKIGFILFVFFVFLSGFLMLGDSEIKYKIGAVQGNYDSFSKYFYTNIYDQFIVHRDLALKLPNNLDLIVFAESVLFCYLNEYPEYLTGLRELSEYKNSPLLIGALERRDNKIYNSAYLIAQDGSYVTHKKAQLVPFVEEVPFPFTLVIPEYFRGLIGNYNRGPGFNPLLLKEKSIGVLICFESLFSDLARELSKKGSDFLVVITNDGWFEGTPAVYQHRNQSLLRAVENRISLVQVANTGITFFVDPFGRVIRESKEGERNIFVAGLPKRVFSVYTFWGDLPIFIGFIIFLLIKLIKE
ncbi:MAG: apolipoprotein N-acyltransferase [Dictyoglomus thermophilum]|uniref:Apolipoprotein N-acyltransferase n=1 Tax=Dictyoglomus thermophilum TaxID=14 RepID=A0A7V3ZK69_DICTH|nr:apolipoprotein N-acyltransferase [Dictyoglomus thermophilum]MCX7720725.1 apolipoprotein N-acyltransferase [Dictyoglomus thermophilum]TYT24139.1 apolipoprotein N-acyltransferase [Dictyoglomus thermophilum]